MRGCTGDHRVLRLSDPQITSDTKKHLYGTARKKKWLSHTPHANPPWRQKLCSLIISFPTLPMSPPKPKHDLYSSPCCRGKDMAQEETCTAAPSAEHPSHIHAEPHTPVSFCCSEQEPQVLRHLTGSWGGLWKPHYCGVSKVQINKGNISKPRQKGKAEKHSLTAQTSRQTS